MLIPGFFEIIIFMMIIILIRMIIAYHVPDSGTGKDFMKGIGWVIGLIYMVIVFFTVVGIVSELLILLYLVVEIIALRKRVPIFVFLLPLLLGIGGLLLPLILPDCGNNEGGPNTVEPTCSCAGVITSDWERFYCIGKS